MTAWGLGVFIVLVQGAVVPSEPAAGAPPLTEAQAEEAAIITLAELYVQEGRLDDALALYERLRTAHPEDARWWVATADVLEKNPSLTFELLLFLQSWHQHDPASIDAGMRLLDLYEKDGAIHEAQRLVAVLLRSHPAKIELLRRKAEAREGANEWKPALGVWKRIAVHPEAELEDRWRLAEVRSMAHPTADHRKPFAALIAEAPKDLRFRVAYIEALMVVDERDEARRALTTAQGMAPKDPRLAKLAVELAEQEREVAADVAQDRVIRLDELRARMDWEFRLRRLAIPEDF